MPKTFTASDSNSGVITSDETDNYHAVWTELTHCPSSSRYAQLVKGKRYGRWWMLKTLKPDLKADAAFQMMLRKEFEMMVSLQHPNIVYTTGWEQVDGLGECIVMEWIDGERLDQWLKTKPKQNDKLRVAFQLIDALYYVHGKQMVHRDLKPQNIMITRNGFNLKLIDFGLSDTDSSVVMKTPAGTSGYADTEQNRQTNVLNDIYSLGQVLRQLRLGIFYNGVWRKCVMPQRWRYQNVDAVKSAMNRIVAFLRIIGLLVFLSVIVLSVSYFYQQRESRLNKQIDDMHVKSQPLGDSVENTWRHSYDTVDKLQLDRSDRNITETQNKALDEKIQEGKSVIDRIAEPMDNEIKNFRSNDEKVFDKLNERKNEVCYEIWDSVDSYCKKQTQLTDADRTILRTTLNDYGMQRYTTSWGDFYMKRKEAFEKQRNLLKEKNQEGKKLIDSIAAPMNEYVSGCRNFDEIEKLQMISDSICKLYDASREFSNRQYKLLCKASRTTLTTCLLNYVVERYTNPWFGKYIKKKSIINKSPNRVFKNS